MEAKNKLQIIALANEFKQWREKLNTSQRELSRLSGIAQTNISRFEDGSSNPTIDTLFALLKPLNLKLKIEREGVHNEKICSSSSRFKQQSK